MFDNGANGEETISRTSNDIDESHLIETSLVMPHHHPHQHHHHRPQPSSSEFGSDGDGHIDGAGDDGDDIVGVDGSEVDVDEEDDGGGDWQSGSDESDSTTGSEGWYSHRRGGMGVSRESSVASRLVQLDEELALNEQMHEHDGDMMTRSASSAALLAKHEFHLRKKAQRAQNARLPCPPMCGVSWGIHGQLLYWSNLPLLTHYLVNNQRRRQTKPIDTGVGGASNGSRPSHPASSTSDAHHLFQSPHHHEIGMGAQIDHDEEESSAWAGHGHTHSTASISTFVSPTAGAAALSHPVTNSSSSSLLHPPPSVSYVGEVDVDEVLPRTYQDLLALPFVAAHLGYVIGEDMEDSLARRSGSGGVGEDDLNSSPMTAEDTPVASETPPISSAASSIRGMQRVSSGGKLENVGIKQWPEMKGTLATGSGGVSVGGIRHSSSGTNIAASASTSASKIHHTRSGSSGRVTPNSSLASSLSPRVGSSNNLLASGGASSSQLPPPSSTSNERVVLGSSSSSGGGSASGSGSGSGGLKKGSSSNSLTHTESGTQLDTLAGGDGYDLIDEYDLDGNGANSGAAGGGGGDDFFSSFYNSSLQLGLTAVGASTQSHARASKPSVPPLPILPPPTLSMSMSLGDKLNAKFPRSSSSSSLRSGVGSMTPTRSSTTLGSPVLPTDEDGVEEERMKSSRPTSAAAAAIDGSTMHSTDGTSHGPHSWTTLSRTQPTFDPHTQPRRRIRINTSVLMMDCSSIIPVDPHLASLYTLSGSDPVDACLANERACRQLGRIDLAATWKLAATISAAHGLATLAHAHTHAHAHAHRPTTTPTQQAALTPWNEHPMGGRLAEQLIQQYMYEHKEDTHSTGATERR